MHLLRTTSSQPFFYGEITRRPRLTPRHSYSVRAFTQDDAHIFCTEDQITEECLTVTNLILEIYKDLGFENVILKYSDRPDLRVGTDSVWDKAEAALLEAVKATKLEYNINKGEGAFYGPKIEFVLRDAIGRDWQCGTLQVDFLKEIESLIKEALPDAKIEIQDLAGDGNHYSATVISSQFAGKSKIQQHKMVYNSLK